MNRKLPVHTIAQYNAADLYRHWGQTYQSVYGRTFQGFPARDLKMLKDVSADFSPAEIIHAMEQALHNTGCNTIPLFVGQIEQHITYREPLASWYYLLQAKTPENREVAYDLIARYMLMDGESVYRRDDEMAEIKKQIEEILA
jgi:hypothetical protein